MKENRKGRFGYQHTMYACFIGYIVQAIINNFIPLLFLTFQSSYGISLSKITFLITFNFGVQLIVDLVAAGFVDKIGYRISILLAHIFSAGGMAALVFLPELCSDPFAGLMAAVTIYALGGGLLEVLVSPILESCPTDNKETAMSLLHSFYCWGHVGVVLISTIYFSVFGIENWRIMALLWMLVPLANAFFFARVPIAPLLPGEEKGLGFAGLFKKKQFWILLVLMVCAGASEQAVSQWASTLAESGLKVSKTVGDLAGPMFFAIMMGTARAVYGKWGEKIRLAHFMYASAALCLACYLLIGLTPVPVLGFVGCGLCGLSVGIMWPGTFSIAAASIRNGGTAMFALLALAGDVGCAAGPTLSGIATEWFDGSLQKGLLLAAVFPVILIVFLYLNQKTGDKK